MWSFGIPFAFTFTARFFSLVLYVTSCLLHSRTRGSRKKLLHFIETLKPTVSHIRYVLQKRGCKMERDYSYLAGQGLLLQAAILERGFTAGSHMSGCTSALVPLFPQTACTIMYPPPHGAEHLPRSEYVEVSLCSTQLYSLHSPRSRSNIVL